MCVCKYYTAWIDIGFESVFYDDVDSLLKLDQYFIAYNNLLQKKVSELFPEFPRYRYYHYPNIINCLKVLGIIA